MALLLTILSASFFTWALTYVETYRVEHPWILCLIPLIIIGVIWDRVRPKDVLSTGEEVRALNLLDGNAHRPVSWLAGIKLVFMTLAAHLLGASVGREAVGMQLGGWASRLRKSRAWNLSACIAAGFAIVIGTPFAAAVFIFESKRWRLSWNDCVGIPLIAWLAFRISEFIGVRHTEYRSFAAVSTELRTINFEKQAIFLTLLVLISTGLSALFLHSLARASRRKPGILNQYVLPVLFLCTIAVVYGWLGARAEATGLPGLGIHLLPSIQISEPDTYNVFNHPLLLGVLKVFLNAAFVGIGVRGGEMTPLFFAGAMTAVGLGALLGLPIAGLVPLGFTVLWGITARRPVTAGILAIEIFGFSPWGSLGVLIAVLVFAGMKFGDFATRWRPNAARTWKRGLYGL